MIGVCIGTIGSVTRVDGHWAEVDFGGVRTHVRTDYLPDAAAGERVLVHAGFIISRLSDDAARATQQARAELRAALDRSAADRA